MGSTVLVFAEVTSCIHADAAVRVSRRPRMKRSDWALFADRVGELARMTADQGVKLAYHHHVGTVVQSAADIERLLETTPDDLWLLLDTGHALYAGADPAAVAQDHGGRIAHVHCKDVRRAILDRCLNNDSSFPAAVLDGVFTVPGDGCVDYRAVLSFLRQAALRRLAGCRGGTGPKRGASRPVRESGLREPATHHCVASLMPDVALVSWRVVTVAYRVSAVAVRTFELSGQRIFAYADAASNGDLCLVSNMVRERP